MRRITGGLTGIATALVLVMLIEAVGHVVYPPPPDLDPEDREQLLALIATLPAGAFAFVLAAWALGSLIGGVIAGLVAGARPLVMAAIVAGLILTGAIAQLVMIPHPLWFSVTAIVAIAVTPFLASRIVRAIRGAPSR